MLIKEVCKETNLTKKAIEYYIEQGLISPGLHENGYRDFSENDLTILRKISVLRKLYLSTSEIKNVLNDNTGQALHKISLQNDLKLKYHKEKQSLLSKLSDGAKFSDISKDLEAIEKSETILNKLLCAFPGYYGRFVTMHFAKFLDEPIKTHEQETAFNEIVDFLDDLETVILPKEIQDFLIEYTKDFSNEKISKIDAKTIESIENIDDFLSENKETLENYINFKQSEEYKNSVAYKLEKALKDFNSESGYNNIFIPAMKKLSKSYAKYYIKLNQANEKLISKYPEAKKLSN